MEEEDEEGEDKEEEEVIRSCITSGVSGSRFIYCKRA